MTAIEYLDRMRTALGGGGASALDDAERGEFIREMESHIEDLRERHPGESEEALIGGLTPPEALAAEFFGAGSPPERFTRFSSDGEAGEGEGISVEREFSAAGIEGLSLEALSADLSLRTVGGDTIKLVALGGKADCLAFSTGGGTLHIEERPGSGLARGGAVQSIRMELPSSLSRIRVKGISGDIHLEGIGAATKVSSASGDLSLVACHGDGELETASGDISARGCGSLWVRSASGDISVAGADGALAVKSVSGDIAVERCAGPLSVTTTSGDVDIKCGPGFGDLEVTTLSGDVLVRLPPGAGALVRASSNTGEVRVGDTENPRGEIRLGEGGPAVRLKSFSGELSVDC